MLLLHRPSGAGSGRGAAGQRRRMQIPPDDPRLTPLHLRRELIAYGESDRTLAAALRTGRLERPRRGAYVDGPTWRTMSDEQRYAVRCRAAYQQSCTDVVLSHSSALPFHDAPLWGGLDLADVHLTRVDRFSGRREAGICRHRGELAEGDVVDVHGVLVTSPVRATLELSTLASTESAIAVANHFLNRGDFTPPAELRERYEQSMANWPGSAATDLLIRLADPRVESVGESRTMYFLYRHHFPKPVPQYEIRTRGGGWSRASTSRSRNSASGSSSTAG